VIYLSILFLIVAVLLYVLGVKKAQRAGIPTGRIIYTDTRFWGRVEKPLYDPKLRLTGKPDYVVRQGKQVIPVEVKSRKSPQVPFDSHIYQLAAYCLLVEHEYGIIPSHGIIHYPERTFAIDFTRQLEASIKAIIIEMQSQASSNNIERSHNEAKRCQRCGYRSICDQTLRI
jgi:CRISPR-associated exonuclease Cas4